MVPELLWPYTMVSVAAKGNTSWVCDPSLVSYALEQPEMLRSPDYSCKRCAQFKFAPTVCDFFWNSPCLGGKGVSNRIWDPCEMLAENDIVIGTSCIIFKMNSNFLKELF